MSALRVKAKGTLRVVTEDEPEELVAAIARVHGGECWTPILSLRVPQQIRDAAFRAVALAGAALPKADAMAREINRILEEEK